MYRCWEEPKYLCKQKLTSQVPVPVPPNMLDMTSV